MVILKGTGKLMSPKRLLLLDDERLVIFCCICRFFFGLMIGTFQNLVNFEPFVEKKKKTFWLNLYGEETTEERGSELSKTGDEVITRIFSSFDSIGIARSMVENGKFDESAIGEIDEDECDDNAV